MDYKHTIDILTENIKELETIVTSFRNVKKIPSIEIDLLMDKTRNLYDVLLLLKQNVSQQSADTTSGLTYEKQKDKSASESKLKREVESDISEKKVNQIEKTKEELYLDEQSELSKAKKESKKNQQKIISDRFKKQSSSLHDSLTKSKHYNDLSSKLQSKPITDITDAIGLNDKFAFIHELFRGDTKKYEETMQILNNAINFNDAFNYLIENFDWDMDSELVQKILELIRRKLITSKNE